MTYEGRIDRFTVLSRLGGGGAGEVSLAFDPDNDREVALKIVHGGVGDRAEMLEAEKKGAEIQERLSREVPQIARIYEMGQIGNRFYIVMEYVPGIDLADLLTGPLHPRRALSFAIQLCEILEACSRVPLPGRGPRDRVVHGDIKPQNIRIDGVDRVRLLDFGVAKSVSLTRQFTGNVFGSLPYLSPERLTESRVSVQSDLWSVGVVLYQMLTGRLPYDASNEEALKAQIQRGGLPQPPSPVLPPQLQQILSRCLQPSPSQRYPDAAALKEALESVRGEMVESGLRRGTETQRTADSPPEPADPASGESIPLASQREPPSSWARIRGWFSAEPRASLLQIQERVRRLGSLPSRARQLGGTISGLHSDIERASRQLWIGPDEVDQLRERTAQLEKVAEPLVVTIREAEQIERAVHALEPRVQGLADPETRAWFASRSRSWVADLQKIGTTVRRLTDLQEDRDQVRRLREDIRVDTEALACLEEAEGILSILGRSAPTEALAAELPALQGQLRKQGASEGWIEHIQTLVTPLRSAAKQAKNPREELQKLRPLLVELRDWSNLLESLKSEVDQIERRHRSLGPGVRLSEVDELARDAGALRERFLRQAREQCDNQLAALDQKVKILVSAAGPQLHLEERLRALRRRQIDVPQSLSDWMRQLEDAGTLFQATAQTHERTLQQGLVEQSWQLRERLEALRGMQLSAAAREEADDLMDEIQELTQLGGGAEQALRRFHRTRQVEERVEQLHQQAAEGRDELHRQRDLLRELNRELQEEARPIGIELPDLSSRIDALGESTLDPSLEAARHAAETLSAELDALRLQLEEQCRTILDGLMSETRTIHAALERAGHSVSPLTLSALASGVSPREAAQAVAEGRERSRLAREEAGQALQAQEEFLLRARSVLEMEQGVLGPDERKAVAARLAEIERELASQDRNLIGRLERRKRLMVACEPLLGRLHQGARNTIERLEALKGRLQDPEAIDLRYFCPELTDRIAGLVYGVPNDRPWQGKAVDEQLTEAERLLSQVEAHSLRLAMEELSRAVQDGERDPNNPVFADRRALPSWPDLQRILKAHKLQQARGGRA